MGMSLIGTFETSMSALLPLTRGIADVTGGAESDVNDAKRTPVARGTRLRAKDQLLFESQFKPVRCSSEAREKHETTRGGANRNRRNKKLSLEWGSRAWSFSLF